MQKFKKGYRPHKYFECQATATVDVVDSPVSPRNDWNKMNMKCKIVIAKVIFANFA